MSETKGLPANLDAERFVLGSILLDDSQYAIAAGSLTPDDFSTERHRRIFRRMTDIQERGERIDRITVFSELMKHAENEADTLSYLVSLDDGLPQIPNIENYVRLVTDKSTIRRVIFATQHLLNRCMSGEETADEIIAGGGETFLSIAQKQQRNDLLSPSQVYDAAGGISAYLDGGKRAKGVRSGFSAIDRLTGGFKAGKLYVIGARPRMGKTAWVLNVAEYIALHEEEVVAIFSLEMTKEELVDRLICSLARVDTRRFDSRDMTEDEWRRVRRAASRIADGDRILIDDKAATSMREIHAKVRRLKKLLEALGRRLGLVVIDYLQLLIEGDVKFRVAETSKISRDMKLLAKDCDVAVCALSQLSRQCDDRTDHRPQLSDLRESGSIEQDADLVGFLYRQEVYLPDREDLRGLAEFIIAKQRNGPDGTVNLVWLKNIVRYESMAEDCEVME